MAAFAAVLLGQLDAVALDMVDGPDMDDQPRLEEVEDEVLDDDDGELGEEDLSGDDAPA